ncbi:hypothetical protein AAMO2058_000665100 [Amorphochlora amoebiformis]
MSPWVTFVNVTLGDLCELTRVPVLRIDDRFDHRSRQNTSGREGAFIGIKEAAGTKARKGGKVRVIIRTIKSSRHRETKLTYTSCPKPRPTLPKCPYCKKTKSVLSGIGANVKIVEVDLDKNEDVIRKGLQDITGRTSVPAVFVNGKFIGGCNDGPGVVPLNRQGKLVPLLKEAGAL